MILHPEIQRKAQEEIDRVIGPHRIPTLSDRDHLPYLTAIQREIYRWGAIVPLGPNPGLPFDRLKTFS